MSEHIIEGPTTKRLERSRSDRMLAGVCGGLARYFDIHPAFYRVGFVVLTLLGGAGILIYLAAALVIPDEGKQDSIVSGALRSRRDRPWPLIGLGLLAIAFFAVLSHATLWPHGDAWILLLLAGGTILWVTRHGLTGEETPDAKALAKEDSRRIRRLFKGLAIAAASVVALVLIAAAIFAAVFHVHLGRGVGNRTYVPASVQELHHSYTLGVGNIRLDLGDVRLPVGETDVNARVDVGNLRVIVPENVAVRVHGNAQLGQLDLLGNTNSGRNVDKTIQPTGGSRVLVLGVHVGVGNVRVLRAVR